MQAVSRNTYQALFLLAQSQLNLEQAKFAAELLEKVDDWDSFLSLASLKHGLPSIYRNIRNLNIKGVPKDKLSAMQSGNRFFTLRTLKINSANAAFHQNCIEPLEAEHFYIKGPSLWARYYDKNHIRICRDVDVVVRKDKLEDVVRLSLKNGYTIVNEVTRDLIKPDDRYLRAIVRYQNVVTLLSPEGVVFELHKWIDKSMGVFSSDELFEDLNPVALGNCQIKVLPTSKLFVYVCYHSTQHLWSHLSWVTDFSAIISHPTFDRPEAQEYAENVGLGRLTTGCMSFYEIMNNPDSCNDLPEADLARKMLNDSVRSLAGDLENEHRMIEVEWRKGPAKRYAGSVQFALRASIKSFITLFRPRIWQYEMLPLSDRLQWVYYPMLTFEYCRLMVLKIFKQKKKY